MKAQVLKRIRPIESRPLELVDLPVPEPKAGEILVKISACGVCHTELDEIEGRLLANLPIVLGHEVVGTVAKRGSGALQHEVGDRVGVAWIYSACGKCRFCVEDRENLCPEFKATGCHVNGGYAEYIVVPADFAYPIPERFTDLRAAPLLCAGAVGFRALRLSGIKPGQTLGIFGFGASAHIVIQVARYWGGEVLVFTRSEEHQKLARKLGAAWAGEPGDAPPRQLDCAIDFTPAGEVVTYALRALEKGGRLVLAVIRKKDLIPPLDYGRLLWEEKEIKSVANVTRKDVRDFLELAAEIPILPEVQEFKLAEANEALLRLKQGKIRGAAVLRVG